MKYRMMKGEIKMKIQGVKKLVTRSRILLSGVIIGSLALVGCSSNQTSFTVGEWTEMVTHLETNTPMYGMNYFLRNISHEFDIEIQTMNMFTSVIAAHQVGLNNLDLFRRGEDLPNLEEIVERQEEDVWLLRMTPLEFFSNEAISALTSRIGWTDSILNAFENELIPMVVEISEIIQNELGNGHTIYLLNPAVLGEDLYAWVGVRDGEVIYNWLGSSPGSQGIKVGTRSEMQELVETESDREAREAARLEFLREVDELIIESGMLNGSDIDDVFDFLNDSEFVEENNIDFEELYLTSDERFFNIDPITLFRITPNQIGPDVLTASFSNNPREVLTDMARDRGDGILFYIVERTQRNNSQRVTDPVFRNSTIDAFEGSESHLAILRETFEIEPSEAIFVEEYNTIVLIYRLDESSQIISDLILNVIEEQESIISNTLRSSMISTFNRGIDTLNEIIDSIEELPEEGLTNALLELKENLYEEEQE